MTGTSPGDDVAKPVGLGCSVSRTTRCPRASPLFLPTKPPCDSLELWVLSHVIIYCFFQVLNLIIQAIYVFECFAKLT